MMNRPSLKDIKSSFEFSSGTDAITYLIGDMAYRVNKHDKYNHDDYTKLINHDVPELVKIHDVWKEDEYLIVKMSRLKEVNISSDDIDDFYAFSDDTVLHMKTNIGKIKNQLLKNMISCQIRVAEALELKIFDFGPHNVMQDDDGNLLVIDP